MERELVYLEWELNTLLLESHINPLEYPTMPEITFLNRQIKSNIKKYLLLKFAFTLVERNYVEFDTEKHHKQAKVWLQDVLNKLMTEIISKNHQIRKDHLESIVFAIDFNETKKFSSAENPGKRSYQQQNRGNSNDSRKAINLSVLENLSLQNQRAAKQYNNYGSVIKKGSKLSKNSQKVLWKNPHRNETSKHPKGKKEKERQESIDDRKDAFKRGEEAKNSELNNGDTEEQKIRKDGNDLDAINKDDNNLLNKISEKKVNNNEIKISEEQAAQTVEKGNLAFMHIFRQNTF